MPQNTESPVARFRHGVRRFLEHPSRRPLLGAAASVYSKFKTGTYTRIRYDDGWLHYLPDGVFIDRRIDFNMTFDHMVKVATENWLWQYKPQPGDTILNIGAGIGTETYAFSRAVGPTGKVISVEAHPATFRCLQRFCELNHLDNVVCLNVAVKDDETEALISEDETHVASTIVGVESGFRVPGATVDGIVRDHGIESLDFLRMNIEGAERHALAGMTDSLARTHHICVSCHDFLADRGEGEGMRTRAVVDAYLREKGFHLTEREDPHPWIRDQVNAVNPRFQRSKRST